MKIYKTLTIAGSDSGGGAGIQADLKAFSANKTFGCSVITALTAQNTQGVTAIHPVPTDFIRAQADAVFSDIAIDAVKIGMLGDTATIKTVAEIIKDYQPPFVVIDPVMVAKNGSRLLQEEAIASIIEYILPLADIITPNTQEAAALLNCAEAQTQEDLASQAVQLQQFGSKNILLKGGHLPLPDAIDYLITENGTVSWFSLPRIDSIHTHGTGCTLSAAICALYPQQHDIKKAVELAKTYVHNGIIHGKNMNIGHGVGPLNHFYQWW